MGAGMGTAEMAVALAPELDPQMVRAIARIESPRAFVFGHVPVTRPDSIRRWIRYSKRRLPPAVERELFAPTSLARMRANYEELARADSRAAFLSSSFGFAQCLGETILRVTRLPQWEAEKKLATQEGQAEIFVAVLRTDVGVEKINSRDLLGIARAYNGPGNVANYAQKLSDALKGA